MVVFPTFLTSTSWLTEDALTLVNLIPHSSVLQEYSVHQQVCEIPNGTNDPIYRIASNLTDISNYPDTISN